MPGLIDDGVERGIGNAPAVPVELAIGKGGREAGRQRAAGEHMLRPDRLPPVVEELQIAGGDVGRSQAEPDSAAVDQRKIREPPQGEQQWRGVVKADPLRRRLGQQ